MADSDRIDCAGPIRTRRRSRLRRSWKNTYAAGCSKTRSKPARRASSVIRPTSPPRHPRRALLEWPLRRRSEELETVLRSAPENPAAIRGLAEIHHRVGDLPWKPSPLRSRRRRSLRLWSHRPVPAPAPVAPCRSHQRRSPHARPHLTYRLRRHRLRRPQYPGALPPVARFHRPGSAA